LESSSNSFSKSSSTSAARGFVVVGRAGGVVSGVSFDEGEFEVDGAEVGADSVNCNFCCLASSSVTR
jgi:hypothetical protein